LYHREYAGAHAGNQHYALLVQGNRLLLISALDIPEYQWACLDWNTHAIGLYRSFGAEPMGDWTTYRFCVISFQVQRAPFLMYKPACN